MKPNSQQTEPRRLIRKIRVGVVSLEPHGIQRGDRVTVAMTGDVRVGELGYFETGGYYGGNGCPRELRSHRWLAFLCDQDLTCNKWIEVGSGFCLRSRLDTCEGEHGAEPHGAREDYESQQPGGVLVETYGRVVSVTRDDEEVETLLNLRGLDGREQAITAFVTRRKNERLVVRERKPKDPKALAPIDKRTQPLTSGQHQEIARLISSSMDSTAKNPKSALTYQGRIVVRREVTTLARIAGVRRLKGHATTFRRALAKFEQQILDGSLSLADQRAGCLAIEHLYRWLHGYFRPQQTEEERQAQLDRWAEQERDRAAAKRKELQDSLRGMILDLGSSMLYPCPQDFPAEGLREGVMVEVRKNVPIENHKLGVVGLGEYIRMDYVHQVDPQRTRLGDDEEIHMNARLDFIGPVIIPDNVVQASDDWPDVIGD